MDSQTLMTTFNPYGIPDTKVSSAFILSLKNGHVKLDNVKISFWP
jgi:hypothetical protein